MGEQDKELQQTNSVLKETSQTPNQQVSTNQLPDTSQFSQDVQRAVNPSSIYPTPAVNYLNSNQIPIHPDNIQKPIKKSYKILLISLIIVALLFLGLIGSLYKIKGHSNTHQLSSTNSASNSNTNISHSFDIAGVNFSIDTPKTSSVKSNSSAIAFNGINNNGAKIDIGITQATPTYTLNITCTPQGVLYNLGTISILGKQIVVCSNGNNAIPGNNIIPFDYSYFTINGKEFRYEGLSEDNTQSVNLNEYSSIAQTIKVNN